jgi:hypothetical protein
MDMLAGSMDAWSRKDAQVEGTIRAHGPLCEIQRRDSFPADAVLYRSPSEPRTSGDSS